MAKEQVAITKQQKEKQKKEKGKNKAFEKTSDNWKALSENFRSVVKAMKKDNADEEENEAEDGEKEEMKILTCNFCDKPFAEVFMEKHLETCARRKETEKKKTTKKK